MPVEPASAWFPLHLCHPMWSFCLKRAIVAVLAGALLTLMVAWSCALWVEVSEEVLLSYRGSPRILHGVGAYRHIQTQVFDESGRLHEAPTLTVRDERGWPLRCMTGTFVIYGIDPRNAVDETHAAIVLSPVSLMPGRDKTELQVIPLQPLWGTFAINTAIYGTVPLRGAGVTSCHS